MNKFGEKLKEQFVAGAINGAVFSYLSKFADKVSDDTIFDDHIIHLNKLNVNNDSECANYFNLYAQSVFALSGLINPTHADINKFCAYVIENKEKYTCGGQYPLSKRHHYIKAALDFINNNKDLMKQSYPNNFGVSGSDVADPQYSIDKWIETMRHIYNAAHTNNLSLDEAAKRITAEWDDKERTNFNYWMRYYQEGNYNKYNVKTAQYFVAPQPVKEEQKNIQNMFDDAATPKIDPKAEREKQLEIVRKKIHSRLDAIWTLLNANRNVMTKEDNAFMRNGLNTLYEKVWNLELRASVVDSIMRTSNQFNKHGFGDGAQALKKLAQDLAGNMLPDHISPGIGEPPAKKLPLAKPKATPPAGEVRHEEVPAETQPAPMPEVVVEEEPTKTKEEPEKLEVVVEKDQKDNDVPDVGVGESISIPTFHNATKRDALKKLEEVSEALSSRSLIRALAAVDIILGQLGIASHFPKLAEAQIKLLEAYNYSSTRIGESISQLRGGLEEEQKLSEQKPEPAKDVVETSEDFEKPVSEIQSGAPPEAE